MNFFDLCIKRPVLATVLSLVVVLLGLIGYQRLSVREYPKIDEPIVSVSTGYKGASPEVIESQITKTLEDSLSGIEGVNLITSNSRSERSDITVSFKITKDPDVAAAEVHDRVVGRVGPRDCLGSTTVFIDLPGWVTECHRKHSGGPAIEHVERHCREPGPSS